MVKDMSAKSNCCLDCPRKGCGAYHSQCPDYQEFLKENEKRKEDIQKWRQSEHEKSIKKHYYKRRVK